MRIKDARVLGPNRFGDALLHLQDLRPGGNQSGLEPDDLFGNLRIIDLFFRWLFVVRVMNKHNAPGDPRSNADTLKSYFRTAHSGTIPHRTVSRSAVRVPEWPSRRQLLRPKASVSFPGRQPAS